MQNVYLANLSVWLVKLHNIHWNVVGPQFVPVHQFTETVYDEVFAQYDAVAELMKMQGKTPAVRMVDYLKDATIEEIPAQDFSAEQALELVRQDMQLMSDLAAKIRKEAAENDDWQAQALFEGYLGYFAKQLWFIESMQRDAGCGCCCGH